jgi:PIN domain nuclease of toxin-antitoxin system
MIVLDTHAWIWWVHGDPALEAGGREQIDASQVIGISAISCWEVAKLVQHQRLALPCPVSDWLQQALSYPGVKLIELTPAISVESTQLPGEFHRDPADQIIVATTRILNAELLTADRKILSYPHVRLIAIS